MKKAVKKKAKKRLSDQQLAYMLFEAEAHRLLDLIGAPKSEFINRRLAEYARTLDLDPDTVKPKN